jgi:hypothetical protein
LKEFGKGDFSLGKGVDYLAEFFIAKGRIADKLKPFNSNLSRNFFARCGGWLSGWGFKVWLFGLRWQFRWRFSCSGGNRVGELREISLAHFPDGTRLIDGISYDL